VSTVLFNLALEMTMRATMTKPGGTIFKIDTMYNICRRCYNTWQKSQCPEPTFIEFTKEARKLVLVVKIQKTKYMIASRNMNRFTEVAKIVIEGTSY
jgi:RNA polymerase subunit RPABC4/transcription elongation factor Spt4